MSDRKALRKILGDDVDRMTERGLQRFRIRENAVERQCTSCEQWYDLIDGFCSNRSAPLGRHRQCRRCNNLNANASRRKPAYAKRRSARHEKELTFAEQALARRVAETAIDVLTAEGGTLPEPELAVRTGLADADGREVLALARSVLLIDERIELDGNLWLTAARAAAIAAEKRRRIAEIIGEPWCPKRDALKPFLGPKAGRIRAGKLDDFRVTGSPPEARLEKRCTGCGRWRPHESGFASHGRHVDGRASRCFDCERPRRSAARRKKYAEQRSSQ